MAQPSNKRRPSDLAKCMQNHCNPNIGQDQPSNGSSTDNIAANSPSMRTSTPHERRILSEMPLGYHESNRRNQFDEAHQTHGGSHAARCQHCTWGCVRCSTLTFLNSPFEPTEHFYIDQIPRSSNNSNQTNMYLNATQTGPLRISRRYTASLLSSPDDQVNTTPQFANMRGFEQQSTPFRASVTPSLSHSGTPQSIFSAPRTSPSTAQNAYDWGTPKTTVSPNLKDPSPRYKVYLTGGTEQLDDLNKDVTKAADDFDTRFLSEDGAQNQQWLQDAELDDLTYRRGSESAAAQQQNQEQMFEHQARDLMATGDHDSIDGAKHSSLHSYMQPTYNVTEPILGQQYFTLEPRAFNPVDLEFSNPFAPASCYNAPSAYDTGNSYNPFDFNGPLYQDAEYPLPKVVIPSNDFHNHSNGNQSHRTGPPRSRHNARDEHMDRKLVEWRESGMSYKEIMAKGNFGLEESTLRGRYRTLTKSKDKRLRKPIWDDHAISALLEAVEHHAPAGSKGSYGKESLDKIPWKRVAEWMEKERKCYLYGNATVKKKYVEVVKSRRLSRRQTTV